MNGAKVGVFEEADQVSFSGFLESEDSGALETEVVLELRSDFTDESLEGELADEELGGLLVAPDLAEGHGAWAVPVGLLDAARSGGVLAGCLGGELLTRGPEGVEEKWLRRVRMISKKMSKITRITDCSGNFLLGLR